MQQLHGEDWLTSGYKRTFDVLTSISLLAPGSAMAFSGAVLISAIDRVNPHFSQTRKGYGSEPFRIHKLRTMPREMTDKLSTGHDDCRASKLGRLLRRTRIDELPQLYNVLRDDMSLVGPRPLTHAAYESVMDTLNRHDQKEWRHARQIAKPGIIDSYGAQLYLGGHQHDRATADIVYAQEASLKTDLRLVAAGLKIFANAATGNMTPLVTEPSVINIPQQRVGVDQLTADSLVAASLQM